MNVSVDLPVVIAVISVVSSAVGIITVFVKKSEQVARLTAQNEKQFALIDGLKKDVTELRERGSLPYQDLLDRVKNLENRFSEQGVQMNELTRQLGKLEGMLTGVQTSIDFLKERRER